MRVDSINDFAATVRGRRRDLGLTQAQLALAAGVSRKWVYEFESGKSAAELGHVMRVLDALRLSVSIDELESHRLHGTRPDLDDVLADYLRHD